MATNKTESGLDLAVPGENRRHLDIHPAHGDWPVKPARVVFEL